MAFRQTFVALPIWLMAWSLTTQFYGPTVAILVLGIAWLYARNVTGSRHRTTMFPRRRRRCASGTSTTASGRRATRFLAPDLRNGSEPWTEGR